MIGQSHDDKRHGTATLFAALNAGTGQIIGKHHKRRRRLEFRDFTNRVVKQYEGKEIHVTLDSATTQRIAAFCDDAGTASPPAPELRRSRRGTIRPPACLLRRLVP
jgi:cytochrome P450